MSSKVKKVSRAKIESTLTVLTPILADMPAQSTTDEPNPDTVEDTSAAPKVSYLICPFCGEKNTRKTGVDKSSTWCEKCAKCFIAVWTEE